MKLGWWCPLSVSMLAEGHAEILAKYNVLMI